MENELIQAPEQAMLKRVNLVREDGGRTTITQRRTHRNGEWGIEAHSDFLSRVQDQCKRSELRGDKIAKITSSSFKADGDEIVQLEMPDIMNRFQLLDYLTVHRVSADFKLSERGDDIVLDSVHDHVSKERHEEGHALDVFDIAWTPSISLDQAMVLVTEQKLSIKAVKGGWEVDCGGSHAHAVTNSSLSLEITRTAVRKLYHDQPMLIPTKFFVALVNSTISHGQKNWSPEQF